MSVRQANERDAFDVFELQNICYEPSMRERLEVFESILYNGGGMSYVATNGDSIVGYLLAHTWRTIERPPDLDAIVDSVCEQVRCVFIHDLAIAPDWRGRGIAKCLFERLASKANGFPIVLVSVNDSARFWEGFGFSELECDCELSSYSDRRAKLMIRWP